MATMRVIFLGMAGDLPARSLRAILDAPCEVVGVVCGEPRDAAQETALRRLAGKVARKLFLGECDPAAIARTRGIDHLCVRSANTPEAVAWVKEREPDLMCITTFPSLLGAELLAVPTIGTINLHLALLPHYRGPDPLFWMARAGESQGGVTIHWVDVGEDTGDILLQEAFPSPDGQTTEELLWRATAVGTRLMRRAVERIAGSRPNVPAEPQGEGHRNPRPRPEDAEIDAAWGARRTYNFVRLARKWQTPYLVVNGTRRDVDEAEWLPERRADETTVALSSNGAEVVCRDGTVRLWRRGRLTRACDLLRVLLRRSRAGGPTREGRRG